LAGGAVGGECNLIVFDAGDVLHDARQTEIVKRAAVDGR
jgi:hypothetical protein